MNDKATGLADLVTSPAKRGHRRFEIARTGKGLRDALFDQLEKLGNGDIDHQDARAFAGMAHAIIKVVEVQIKYESMVRRDELKSSGTDVMEIGVAQEALDAVKCKKAE